jgi:S-adenosyl methyltransferase
VEPDWVPPGIDTTKANTARVHDYWLGGSHNFPADQDAARAVIALGTDMQAIARANRAFPGRAVRLLAGQAGIRQFLDIGSGIPTEQNVHQVAPHTAPGSRVVYVDNDEVPVAHSRLILEDNFDCSPAQNPAWSGSPNGRPTPLKTCPKTPPGTGRSSAWADTTACRDSVCVRYGSNMGNARSREYG